MIPENRTMAVAAEIKGRSLWQDAFRRLSRNRASVTAAGLLLVVVLMAIVGPWLTSRPYYELYLDHVAIPPDPSAGFLFGTDGVGRDLFVRTLYGTRISLLVALAATSVSLAIGIIYGAVAGYMGGRVDNLMMRFVDIMYALPFMFFVIILMVVFGRNIVLMFVALGAVEWLTMSRIVRGQTLALKSREFVEAAIASGVTRPRIILRHIIPNLLGPVAVYITLTIPQVILVESFLSFLGLGVQEPLTSLGVLISEGAAEMETAPWMLIFPASTLALMLFCFNFIGDGVRDALDPKDR